MKRSTLVFIAKWVFWPAVVVAGLNLEKLAEALGWDSVLLMDWSPLMRSLIDAFQAWWVQAPALFLLGLSVGVGLDNLLRKQEIRAGTAPASDIDRGDLAARAQTAANRLFSLYGEWSAQANIEWVLSTDAIRQGAREGGSFPRDDRRWEAKFVERYAAQYAADVWSILQSTSKVMSLDYGELWRHQHGIHSASDVHALAVMLSKIADDLRHPQTAFPMHNTPEELQRRANLSGLPQSQPQPSTEEDKPL